MLPIRIFQHEHPRVDELVELAAVKDHRPGGDAVLRVAPDDAVAVQSLEPKLVVMPPGDGPRVDGHP